MAKTRYPLDEMFDAQIEFQSAVASYKDYTHQTKETIKEMPLRFLLCLLGGQPSAAYYLGVCFDQGQGVTKNKDLSNLMFNVSLLLGAKKDIVSQILQGEVLAGWITQQATKIADIVGEATTLNHSYQEILQGVLDLDKSMKISMLKNINSSPLRNDFIHIKGAIGYLSFSSEAILVDLITSRCKSDESCLSTIFDSTEGDLDRAFYETLVKGRTLSNDDVAEAKVTGETSFICVDYCVVS